MDCSPWTCAACGCHAVAADLASCPQCAAPRDTTEPQAESAPQPDAAPAKASKAKGG